MSAPPTILVPRALRPGRAAPDVAVGLGSSRHGARHRLVPLFGLNCDAPPPPISAAPRSGVCCATARPLAGRRRSRELVLPIGARRTTSEGEMGDAAYAGRLLARCRPAHARPPSEQPVRGFPYTPAYSASWRRESTLPGRHRTGRPARAVAIRLDVRLLISFASFIFTYNLT